MLPNIQFFDLASIHTAVPPRNPLTLITTPLHLNFNFLFARHDHVSTSELVIEVLGFFHHACLPIVAGLGLKVTNMVAPGPQ